MRYNTVTQWGSHAQPPPQVHQLQNLVVHWSGRRLLARIGAEIGTYDRGGAIGPPKPRRERWSGGLICIGRLHFDLRNLNGQTGTSFGNLRVWLAPGSLIRYFLGIFPDLAFQLGLLWWKHFEGDGADPARFRKGGVGSRSAWSWSGQFRSGPEGFLIGRSGCDQSDQGQLSS